MHVGTRRGVLAAAGAVTAFALAGRAWPAVVARSVEELSKEAGRIVVGDVTAVEPFVGGESSLTMSRVAIAVTDDLKGEGPAEFELVLFGGTIDGVTLYTSITPTFLAGDHVLLFLRADGTIAGAYQGAYLTDGVLAVRMEPGFQRYEPGEQDLLEKLLAEIARALPGQGIPGSVAPYHGTFTLRGDGAAAYTLSDCNWSYQAAPMGESYFVNGNCADSGCGSPATVRAALDRGADVWVNAGNAFYFNELTTTASVTVSLNNQNIIYFQQVDGLDPSAVAATFFWCSGSNMSEWDIAFNDFDFPFWDGVTGSCGGFRYDIQGVAAHEFGHALGLGHSSIGSATMFFSTGPCATAPRTLHSDDIAGAEFIYGDATVALPLVDDFPAASFGTNWVGVDGALSNDVGVDEPSPPNSANFDGATDGGNKLVSAFLDLSGLSDISVNYAFQRAGGGDVPDTGADLIVEYSNTSGLWTELTRHLGDGTGMVSFEPSALALPPAAYHANFHVRFRVTSSFTGVDDWFVDDLCIGDAGDCIELEPCPWDCQASPDGAVGINDLLALLAQWGAVSSCDFDGGGVGINDLLEMLGSWGGCP